MQNLLKGISQIVSFSIRDENLHSKGGIWLFRTMCDETPGLHAKVRDDIYAAANTCFELEKNFIHSLFSNGTIRTMTKEQLVNFIANRINTKLIELGYNAILAVDPTLLGQMSWFDMLAGAREFGDFFAVRVTEYTKTEFNVNDLF
jgi:ribonucleoside-diphosphate reductase beta chain